jgi:hypothetical protein
LSEVSPEGYWMSETGVNLRLEMLGQSIVWGSFNNAIKVSASSYGVHRFTMAGLPPVCKYCQQYYGHTYRMGQFMPNIPAHPYCTHYWDIYFPWREESDASKMVHAG